jgi:Phage portal protein, lambda family
MCSTRSPSDRSAACRGWRRRVRLWLLDQYDDAELDRKKVAAMFAGLVTRPGPDDVMGEDSAQKDSDGAALIGLQPGTMQLLLPGEDIKFSDSADVGGSYEAFQYRTLLLACWKPESACLTSRPMQAWSSCARTSSSRAYRSYSDRRHMAPSYLALGRCVGVI